MLNLLKHLSIFLIFGLDYIMEKFLACFGYILGLVVLWYLFIICKYN